MTRHFIKFIAWITIFALFTWALLEAVRPLNTNAATLYNGGFSAASTTLSLTNNTTKYTVLFWGKMLGTTGGGFAFLFGGADIVWGIAQRGAGAGNVMSCQTNTNAGVIANGAQPPGTNWMGYACTINTSNITNFYQFNLDGTLFATGAGTLGAITTTTADSVYIGSIGGGAVPWNGAIRGFQVFHYTMTQNQIRNALMARSPYQIGSPDYFFPLTANTDVRGWLNGARLALTSIVAATTVKDPPIGMLPF